MGPCSESDAFTLIVGSIFVGVWVVGALVSRSFVRARRFATHGKAWQEAVLAMNPQARILKRDTYFTAEFHHEGLPFFVQFEDYVHVGARVPKGLQVKLPTGGKVEGLPQKLVWIDGSPAVRLGVERNSALRAILDTLVPTMRQALGEAARIDVGPLS